MRKIKERVRRIRDIIKRPIDKFISLKSIAFFRKLFKLNGYSYMPSSLTFYVVISAVPFFSIILMVLSHANTSSTVITSFLEDIFGDNEITDVVLSNFQEIKTTDILALIFSSTISIYIASRGIECFSRFADHFYNRHELDNHLIKRKIRSIIMTVVSVFLLSFIIVFILFWDSIIGSVLPSGLALTIKYISAFVAFFIIISMLFYFAPTTKPKFKDVVPGAYLASISTLIFTFLFLTFAGLRLDRYNNIYGPLSILVILLLMIYFDCYIVFMCFYLNILILERKTRLEKIIKIELQ